MLYLHQLILKHMKPYDIIYFKCQTNLNVKQNLTLQMSVVHVSKRLKCINGTSNIVQEANAADSRIYQPIPLPN